MASAESGDDSIYNVCRPTTEKIYFLFFSEENLKQMFFLLLFFTRKKNDGAKLIAWVTSAPEQKK